MEISLESLYLNTGANKGLAMNIVCPSQSFSKKLMSGAKSQIIILFNNFHFNDIPGIRATPLQRYNIYITYRKRVTSYCFCHCMSLLSVFWGSCVL